MLTAKLRLRTWAPEYDLARPGDDDPPQRASVTVDVEVPARLWAPIRPGRAQDRSVVFIDGVQRIDGWADIASAAAPGEEAEAILGSYAAGAIRCGTTAEVVELSAPSRSCFCRVDPGLGPVGGPFNYAWKPVEEPGTSLEDALNRAMNDLEVQLASRVAGGGELVVVDGPLRQRDHLSDIVGYIKSHRATYLTDPHLAAVVSRLGAGERTPVFRLATRWERYSWYARLPALALALADQSAPLALADQSAPLALADQSAWHGIVRGEAGSHLEAGEAIDLADRMTATVRRYASSPIKDPRAPQNLVPVGALERLLRHRLGDRELLLRGLRRG